MAFGFIRFVGEFRPASRLYPGKERRDETRAVGWLRRFGI
jgi:hypothetical protein